MPGKRGFSGKKAAPFRAGGKARKPGTVKRKQTGPGPPPERRKGKS